MTIEALRRLAALASVSLLIAAMSASGCSSSSSTGGACTSMAAPGSLAFAAACCQNSDCKTNDCVSFAKGQYCSHACSSDADCVNDHPSDGSPPKCGGMGVCKAIQ